jgi:endonuclease-3
MVGRRADSSTPKPSSRTVHAVMRGLARAIDNLDLPAVEKIAEDSREDPFEVLIATMLSAQTRDPVTAAATGRLFKVARTPKTIAQLSEKQIEKLIYPVSFYRNKAVHVKQACRMLVDRFGGRPWTSCCCCRAWGARPRTSC